MRGCFEPKLFGEGRYAGDIGYNYGLLPCALESSFQFILHHHKNAIRVLAPLISPMGVLFTAYAGSQSRLACGSMEVRSGHISSNCTPVGFEEISLLLRVSLSARRTLLTASVRTTSSSIDSEGEWDCAAASSSTRKKFARHTLPCGNVAEECEALEECNGCQGDEARKEVRMDHGTAISPHHPPPVALMWAW